MKNFIWGMLEGGVLYAIMQNIGIGLWYHDTNRFALAGAIFIGNLLANVLIMLNSDL
jgi:hypothetical protein